MIAFNLVAVPPPAPVPPPPPPLPALVPPRPPGPLADDESTPPSCGVLASPAELVPPPAPPIAPAPPEPLAPAPPSLDPPVSPDDPPLPAGAPPVPTVVPPLPGDGAPPSPGQPSHPSPRRRGPRNQWREMGAPCCCCSHPSKGPNPRSDSQRELPRWPRPERDGDRIHVEARTLPEDEGRNDLDGESSANAAPRIERGGARKRLLERNDRVVADAPVAAARSPCRGHHHRGMIRR